MSIRIAEQICGNIFLRPNEMDNIGDLVEGHHHHFDHTTFIVSGAFHVKAKSASGVVREKDFQAGEFFLVRANTDHEITAIKSDKQKRMEALIAKFKHSHVSEHVKDLIAELEKEAIEKPYFVCIYSHRDPQGNITQETTGWAQAYN